MVEAEKQIETGAKVEESKAPEKTEEEKRLEKEKEEEDKEDEEEREIKKWRAIAKEEMEKALADRKVKHRVFFELSTQDDYDNRDSPSTVLGNLEIDLWDNQPNAVENFRAHCTGEKGTYQKFDETKKFHYKDCTFHRILKDKFMQSGDTCYDNGCGGHSIFDEEKEMFDDEKTIEAVNADGEKYKTFPNKHDAMGVVSMANMGENTQDSKFFITFVPRPDFDDHHSVVGVITKEESLDLLKKINEEHGHETGQTEKRVYISNCGELE